MELKIERVSKRYRGDIWGLREFSLSVAVRNKRAVTFSAGANRQNLKWHRKAYRGLPGSLGNSQVSACGFSGMLRFMLENLVCNPADAK